MRMRKAFVAVVTSALLAGSIATASPSMASEGLVKGSELVKLVKLVK
jgi:hypothetical protein